MRCKKCDRITLPWNLLCRQCIAKAEEEYVMNRDPQPSDEELQKELNAAAKMNYKGPRRAPIGTKTGRIKIKMGKPNPYSLSPVPSSPKGATYPNVPNNGPVITASKNPYLGSSNGQISMDVAGVPIITVYETLPQEATPGQIAFQADSSAAYVYDGHAWRNLGDVARVLSDRDQKCDRRAAVAATKAKNESNP